MGTITSVNAIITLSIASIFPTPQQLQGFSADDIFTNDPVVPTEAVMGLDGVLSGGYVNVPVIWGVVLQADSASNDVFDQWRQSQKVAQDVFKAQGVVIMPSTAKKYAMVNGLLTSYPTMADAARTQRPRRYAITWESVDPAPF